MNSNGRQGKATPGGAATYEADYQSKQKAIKLLQNTNNFKSITDTSIYNRYSVIDIVTENKLGKKIGYEIKERNIPSTQFNDHMCEKNKVDYAKQQIQEGNYDNIYLMSMFTDNKVFFSSLTDNYTLKYHYGRKTTEYDDKSIIKHYDCVFQPKWIFDISNDNTLILM